MLNIKSLIISILLTGFFSACQTVLANDSLPADVVHILNKHKLPHSSMSIYVKEVGKFDPLLIYNINKPRNPASVMKLITTLAGLELLGPNYKWETEFYINGNIAHGTLNGDMLIKGGGDPFYTRENLWHSLFTLQAKGIKHIKGNLIVDNSLYVPEKGNTGNFDKKPYRAYNVFPDAALINFTAQQFIILPNGKIYADPPSSNLEIRNKLKLIKGKCRGLNRSINMNVIHNGPQTITEFSGNYPLGCGKREFLRSVSKNTDFAYGVFRALWENMGGTITGTVKNGLIPKKAALIHQHTSKPLREIIQYINKHSNNVMARQLMLTIGKEIHGEPGTKQTAILAINDWLDKQGIRHEELIIDNGAGLSRNARISALTLGRILEHAYRNPLRPEYLSSLPIAGVDGTMKKRFNGTIPKGKIRIKTGLLNNVRSMAGYVSSKNGKQYIIVSLQNHHGVQNSIGTEVQDVLLKWLYHKN